MSAESLPDMAGTPPNRIRELRQEAKLSQQFIGKSIGVSKMTISELERGLLPLTLHYMRGIAKVLSVDPVDLLPPADNPFALSDHERALIEMLGAASERDRTRISAALDAYFSCDDEG